MNGEIPIPEAEATARSRGDLALRFFAAVAVLPLRQRIGAVVFAFVIGFALRYALIDLFGERAVYFTFYPAVLTAALLFGTYAGYAAVAVAILLIYAPLGAAGIASLGTSQNFLVLGIFLLNCAALIFLARLLDCLARARRESERLVRLNAEQFGHFVEQAPAAMAMFDRDMRCLACSARWRDIHGPECDTEGKSHFGPETATKEEWRELHRRVLSGETVSCNQDRFVGPDGSVRWLRWEVRPWRFAHDGIGGAIIFSEDITERLLVGEAMRENEMRLNAIVDAAMEAIISIDGKGLIQSANPAAREMFGYDKSELLGCDIKILMPNHYNGEHNRYVANYLAGGKKHVIGLRRKVEGRRKDGSIFPLELTVGETAFNQDIMFVGFLRDLSPIEEERRRFNALRDDLVHVSRLNDMGEVVAGLAHEVGQPIAAILNFSAAHRRAMFSTGIAPEPDLIGKIEAQARRAAEILKRLRGFIEKRPPERGVAKIHELIDDAVMLSLLRSRAQIVYLPPGEGGEIRVCVDRIQIGQVLVNLLRNADDALHDAADPEILVETFCNASGMIRVAVADNGLGVEGEAVEQLFSPFFSTKKYGMGVGLSISKSIVEAHGGVISYRANAPRGSIFEFTLPIFDGDDSDDKPREA